MNFENQKGLSIEDVKKEESIKNLNNLMSKAVDDENYEEAAVLRDKIDLIKKGGEIVENENDKDKQEEPQKMNKSLQEIMANNKNEYIELIKEAINEAILNNEYELIDVYNKKIEDIKSGEEKLMGERVDVVHEPGKGIIGGESKYSRANDYLREKVIANYMKGENIVKESSLTEFFDGDERFVLDTDSRMNRNIPDIIKQKLREIGNDKEKRIDLLLDLYKKRADAENLVLLTGDKLNSIWQPYRHENKLYGQEYQEYKTHYNKGELTYSFTGEQLNELNKVPEVLAGPLEFWQSSYDRARIMLDNVNKAIEEIEKSPSNDKSI
ncbi:MAG: UvrB/UvrC motif-containing protein [Planctomycetes bacterium]|jgi:hypothetical protein|nr:UvrB/UvrC motif-containing protein [Planctomycetota bacterium]